MAEPVAELFIAAFLMFIFLFPWLLMLLGLGFVIYLYLKNRKKEHKLEQRLEEKDSGNY